MAEPHIDVRMPRPTEIRIVANGPFDHRAALGTLAAHAIEGLYRFDAERGVLTRWVDVDGELHPVEVRLDAGGATVQIATRDQAVNDEVVARVRHWFDLDTDLAPVNARLGCDPIFAAQVAVRPGLRITRFHAAFEAVILTVLGQQVSLAAARLFGSRLVTAYGTGTSTLNHDAARDAAGLCGFPTPAVLAAQPLDELRAAVGLTRSRARTVHETAALFVREVSGDVLPARSVLQAIHGIGPWTLDYLAIRAGTEPDAFPASDAVLRRALQSAVPAKLAARVDSSHQPAPHEAWRPYRSYAASRLWAMGEDR